MVTQTAQLIRYIAVFCIILVSVVLIRTPVFAAANDEIHYQGKLYDSNGDVVADDTYSIQFKLYTAATGGSAIWTETQSVTTDGGLFTVLLGSTNTLSGLDWNQSLYLGITVESDSEMTPRHTIASVPSAHTITGVLGVAQGGTGTSTTTTSGAVLFAGEDGTHIGDVNYLYVATTTSRVGIGTSSPAGTLHISNASSSNAFVVTDDAKIGIGTSTPMRDLHIIDSISDAIIRIETGSTTGNAGIELYTPDSVFLLENYNTTAGTTTDDQLRISQDGVARFIIDDDGYIGIGTTSPTAQLHTTGSVRFGGLGAGTLTTDGNGNITVSSDERLKDIVGSFELGLNSLRDINPIRYRWNATSGLETTLVYAGFSAQNVLEHIEDAVSLNTKTGYYTLSDRPILAAAVNAIKEIDTEVELLASSTASTTDESTFAGRFFSRIRDWFADTANGIGSFFANSFTASDTICINDTCITEADLQEIIASEPDSSVEATFTLNGADPFYIDINDVFNDPGATLVDGATTTIVYSGADLNTAHAATSTVWYHTTSDVGDSLKVSRKVVIIDSVDVVTETDMLEVASDTSIATSTEESVIATTTDTTATSSATTTSETIDVTQPVIIIEGGSSIVLTEGDIFMEPIVTATDEVDGDVTVISEGEVDTTTAGEYTITYTATDAAGNSATETLTVIIEAAPVVETTTSTSTASST